MENTQKELLRSLAPKTQTGQCLGRAQDGPVRAPELPRPRSAEQASAGKGRGDHDLGTFQPTAGRYSHQKLPSLSFRM